MTRYLVALAVLALTGCSAETQRTYTVDELIADDALLSRIIAKCRNDPGMLRKTANCVNAEAADGKLRLERMRKALRG